MNQGIKTIIYPVQDIARAKTVFCKFLGVEPSADQPYYVGFRASLSRTSSHARARERGVESFLIISHARRTRLKKEFFPPSLGSEAYPYPPRQAVTRGGETRSRKNCA
jgi:hypothetical protein